MNEFVSWCRHLPVSFLFHDLSFLSYVQLDMSLKVVVSVF